MVKAIGSFYAANNDRTVRQRTIEDGKKGLTIGIVGGAIEGFTRKSWLDRNNKPEDKFIKQVAKGLEYTLTNQESKELDKVNNFFAALTDYKTDVYSLRDRIENSTELTNALPKKENESTKETLDRMFSNKDKLALKNQLREMQTRTQVDKKVNIYTAKNLINKNFDSTTKSLKKTADTSESIFKVIKQSAKRIKIKTAIQHTGVGGVLLGIAGLLIGASKPNN